MEKFEDAETTTYKIFLKIYFQKTWFSGPGIPATERLVTP
jgi:hypothetical protein